ncbi:hypothetical protein JCM10914A_54590 [Paenibacillus sp. JCM 10914]|uniref:hypothetical protein n=1 Tax=Paenibacillus sp. JCM 10914 TaxID=1236974 RepID=UPI0003CC851D|nr:hypothetical protein [Paenibacillus sp. JCM 10914]GAE04800.1 conserved domain protein [Paenibacillus sp. JCM 10914]
MMNRLRFYLISGFAGFIFTFILTIRNNPWMTSMNRALIALVIWCALAVLLRWLLGAIAKPAVVKEIDAASESQLREDRGTRLDLTTPDEDRELMDLMHADAKEGGGFVPLNPPKLVSTKDPEELAKAVRHLTNK